MFRKIANANDGSANAFKALEAACELAAKFDAELHLVIVEEIPAIPGSIEEVQEVKAGEDKHVRANIKRADLIAGHHQVKLQHHVFTGHVVRNIVDFANDNGFDLLVIGATGNAALYERMLGTRADRIAHMAHCPVLIVR